MTRSRSLRTTLAVLAVVVLTAVARLHLVRPRSPESLAALTDLASMDGLQAQFNRDAGRPRLLILVSPT